MGCDPSPFSPGVLVSLGRPGKGCLQLPSPCSSAWSLAKCAHGVHQVSCPLSCTTALWPPPLTSSLFQAMHWPQAFSALWSPASTSSLMHTKAKSAVRGGRSHLWGGPYFHQVSAKRALRDSVYLVRRAGKEPDSQALTLGWHCATLHPFPH